jgi:cell division septal protein FtsQ
MKRQTQPHGQRLRKQPTRRRVQATLDVAQPRLVMPDTAARRRKRNRQRIHMPTAALKRVFLSSRWISGGLLALCLYALMFIGQDERFYLTVIPVEGVASIPPSEIVAASALGGTHVFAADPNAAAAAINELPGVISATVTLRWPNEVSIKLVEDSPIAIWEQAGEQFWVNKDGHLTPARVQVVGLLHIRSELADPVGELTFIPVEVLDGALQLRQLRPNIELLYYRPATGLSFEDGRGWRVSFGAGTDMPQKLVVYETIVEDLVTRGLRPSYISVANQEKPYYMASGS